MFRYNKSFILLFLILISHNAYAGVPTLGTISADATAAGINDNFTTLRNVLAGQVEGSTDSGATVSNVKADTIFEINMADDANGRVRDSELFNITVDSVSGGTLTQGAVVESGCVPADDTDLTSDVSACVAYVNGYRVSKAATAVTYIASRDNYLDMSQTGVFTVSDVALGATQPTVAANSVRLAKVVTNGTEITTITSLYTTRVPGLIIPSHYRSGVYVSQASTTTINVAPGSLEINNSMVTKTSATTLTLSTAGDWAGGSSLQAANTLAFVGIDASGNIKMHTTKPTHDNYAVSTTAGIKRYVTWSSTVYRVIGWFYMNASSQVTTSSVSNIADIGVKNIIISNDSGVATSATIIPWDSSIPTSTEGVQLMAAKFYPTDYKSTIQIQAVANVTNSIDDHVSLALFSGDGTAAIMAVAERTNASASNRPIVLKYTTKAQTEAQNEWKIRIGPAAASTTTLNGSGGLSIFGAANISSITIEELDHQTQ